MSEFEYVSALTSIIIALAAANVLASLAETIKHRRTTQWFWVHSAWCVTLFYALVATWWASWRTAEYAEGLSVFWFFVQCLPLGIFYVASHLLRPNFATGSVDLKQYFYEIKNPFFICFLVMFVPISVVVLIVGSSASDTLAADLVGGLSFVCLSIWGIASKSPRVHGAIVLLWLAIFVAVEEIQGGL